MGLISRRVLSAIPTGGATVELGITQVQYIRVDNYSPNWLHLINAQVYVAPYTLGFVGDYSPTVTSETVRAESPPGAPTPPAGLPAGQIVLTAYQDLVPPSQGVPYALTPSSVSTAVNPAGTVEGASWDSINAPPATAQIIETVVAVPWLYTGLNNGAGGAAGKELSNFVGARQLTAVRVGTVLVGTGGTTFSAVGGAGPCRIMWAVLSADTSGLLQFGTHLGPGSGITTLLGAVEVTAGKAVRLDFKPNGLIIATVGAALPFSATHAIGGAGATVTLAYTIGLAP